MGRLGLGELLVIAGVVLLFVGPKRLPELGKAMGEALRAFQRAVKGPSDPDDTHKQDPHTKT